MQKLMIAGTVGKDPELRRTQTGKDVLGFSLAVDNGKDRDGSKLPATWYDCSVWDRRATALQPYIKKGSRLTLIGRPSARAHDGKAYLQISVDDLAFQGGGKQEYGDVASGDQAPGGYEDEIPF